MRRAVCWVLIVVCVWRFFPNVASAADIPFPDTANSWFVYRESIAYLQSKDAISGYPDGTFKPKTTVNRAEFLKLVFRARGAPEPVSGDCFLDVKQDSWYAPFVCAAVRRGIVVGYPSGTGAIFKPEQPVVFSEAIKMVLEAYGKDVQTVSGTQWYEPYAAVLDTNGVLGRHSFIPWDPLTRERAADLIAKFVRFEEDRKIPNLSSGCNTAAGIPPSGVHVNGVDREFLLTVPAGYVSHDPSPLIVAFHGRTNGNAQVRSYYRFDRLAKDAFVAYPAALKNGGGSYSWSVPNDLSKDLGDVAFFDAIVEAIARTYCIDMNRVFVAGHSLGAWMSNSIACVRGDVVRASGTVGGDSVFRDCPAPAAAMIIHNPEDSLAPFSGAERLRDMRVKENACLSQTKPMEPQTLLCREYAGCDGGNAVVWCPHEIDVDERGVRYTHNWPRDASTAIVNFFNGMQ